MRTGVAAALAFLLAGGAAASPSDVQWDEQGRFAKSWAVRPGNFAEACARLETGQSVQWSFDAKRSLDFNVHHHLGRQVVYSDRRAALTTASGSLRAEDAQVFCWMWSAPAGRGSAIPLRVVLHRTE